MKCAICGLRAWLRATVGWRSQCPPTTTISTASRTAAITHTTSVKARRPGTWTGRVAPAVATIPVPMTEANQLGPMLPGT
jgi:hypothetical protein